LSDLEATRSAAATKGFFEELVNLILERDRTLRDLREMPQPVGQAEIKALKNHLLHYEGLLKQIDATNASMKKFLDQKQTSDNERPRKSATR
jgi:hypothetical protein